MIQNEKYVKLVESDHSIQVVLCVWPGRRRKPAADLSDTIAVTSEEVRAINIKQRKARAARLREVELFLIKELPSESN
jgi:hypothetical protein